MDRSNGHTASLSDTRWIIRRGTGADFPAVAHLHEAVYGVRRAASSFHWLYEANPAGRCQLWVAEERASGQLIASRPVFPWRLWINGREARVAQFGDAMTHPRFQGQGIFSALVGAASAALLEQGIPFSFSFSNPGSLSVYKKTKVGTGRRAGTHEVLQFRRMVRPLSLEALLGRGQWARGIIGALDRVVRPYWRRGLSLPRNLSLVPLHHFGEEFDEVWQRARGAYGVLTVRDSAYLNWRFIDAPRGAFRVLSVRQAGVLSGYVAFELDSLGHGWIADLFGLAQPEIVAALLKGALSYLVDAGAVKAGIWTPIGHHSYGLVRNAGFIPRHDVFPMAVHAYCDDDETRAALDDTQWWAWFGDRDVERHAA